MKKEIKLLPLIFSLFIWVSCSNSGGDDDTPTTPPNRNPTAVSQLIYPSADLLCINNTITFEWSAATDADGDPISYKLVIGLDRNLTNIVDQRTVSTTNATVTVDRGVAFYWRVTAMDNQGGESDPSSTFAFYTEGDGVSNHAPFTAALISPDNEGAVNAGTVNLAWTGGDTDTGDTLIYDVFFGEASDPPSIQMALADENFDVSVTSGLTYYWRVDTIDDSGIKTIGQIWSFNVN
jgi:hypothetical protein